MMVNRGTSLVWFSYFSFHVVCDVMPDSISFCKAMSNHERRFMLSAGKPSYTLLNFLFKNIVESFSDNKFI